MTWWNQKERREDRDDLKRKSDHELLVYIAEMLRQIVTDLAKPPQQLTSIQIAFSQTKIRELNMGTTAIPPQQGASLTIGQMVVASVVGYDQFGNVFTGAMPTPAWSIDNPQVASIVPDSTTPTSEDVTGVSAGSANLTAGVAGPGGSTLTATAPITVSASSQPVLTSIQIAFVQPGTVGTPSAASAAKKLNADHI